MTLRIDIDTAFNAVVKKCGGLVLSDILKKSPSFANADYIFHESKVIAELKCLREDKSNDPALKQRLGELWIKWRQRGLVQGPAPPGIYSHALPTTCQNEMYQVMGESIKRRIKKANAQIRATKSALELPDYQGVLFLANDGNFIFEMPSMIHLIFLTIKNHFHEIENVIFFTANMYSLVRGMHRPACFWIHLTRDESPALGNNLSNRLYMEWVKHYNLITGQKIESIEIGDMEFFSRRMKSHFF